MKSVNESTDTNGWKSVTSKLSGVPGSMNREPRESSLLTMWPFKALKGSAGDNMVQHFFFPTLKQ